MHQDLSAEEIEGDVSEQQRLDRPGVLSKHKATDVTLPLTAVTSNLQSAEARRSLHPHRHV